MLCDVTSVAVFEANNMHFVLTHTTGIYSCEDERRGGRGGLTFLQIRNR